MKELIKKANTLFRFHPTPWRFYTDGFFGFIDAANGKHIVGGEPCEGYVSKSDKNLVALVKTINALGALMKEE